MKLKEENEKADKQRASVTMAVSIDVVVQLAWTVFFLRLSP